MQCFCFAQMCVNLNPRCLRCKLQQLQPVEETRVACIWPNEQQVGATRSATVILQQPVLQDSLTPRDSQKPNDRPNS